jgi:hypothetical protein
MFRKSLSENAEKQSVGLAGGQLTGRGDCPHRRKVTENWIKAAFYYGL